MRTIYVRQIEKNKIKTYMSGSLVSVGGESSLDYGFRVSVINEASFYNRYRQSIVESRDIHSGLLVQTIMDLKERYSRAGLEYQIQSDDKIFDQLKKCDLV